MCYVICCFYRCQFFTVVVPSPKVMVPPHNLSTTVGSKAVFTCEFEASTDKKLAQLHWEFNGSDLAVCQEFRDRINCTITLNGTNYITSTLEINAVQANNAGQYTCYCSYNTSILNVDVQIIQSERKSATLYIQPGSDIRMLLYIYSVPSCKYIGSSSDERFYVILGASFGVFIVIVLFIILVLIYRKKYMGQDFTLHQSEVGELHN